MKSYLLKSINRLAIAGVVVATLSSWSAAEAAERLRISLDTNPSHARNKGVELFVEALKKRVGDEMEIEVYPSGQLYSDRDVGRALRQGSVDMAIPGTWVLGGMAPSMAMTTLPAFYGLPKKATLELMDGELGEAINRSAEEKMRVKVLGPWMNLGFSQYFSTETPLKSQEDLSGLRVRVSGGTANAVRVKAFGGVANVIAWPDVPLALSTDVVDAMSSTYESIASAQLWDSGLSYALEDKQWFSQYVPMVSQRFWDDLSEEHKQAMTGAWNEVIDEARSIAAEAQKEAREEVKKQGIEIVVPSQEELAHWRQKLMPYQDQLVSELSIEPELVDMAMQSLRKHGYVN